MAEMDFDALSEKLLEILSRFPEIHLGIVFGSHAAGTAGPKSDVDLAVAADGPLPLDRREELVSQVSTVLDREVDLVDLMEATGTVFKEALGRGRIILKRDSAKLSRILLRMIYEEEDFQKMRRSLMAARRKRVFGVK